MDKLKEKVQSIDWWEVSYLIIYGVIFAHEFSYTTMFDIQWPPKIGYVFMAVSALYTIAKFIWHNTYTKKEMILSVLIIIAFVMPAILTDYSYIFWVGFLIVGAKDVDFKKILKVYLVISVTYMVVAFSASQYGLIEDLIYNAYRYGIDFPRHSYGIVYPTDYAAHLFYMVLAAVVLFDEKMSTMMKVWLSILVACSTFMTGNAQTTMLCLFGFAILCVLERVFRRYMNQIEKILRWTPLLCAVVFLSLTCMYDSENEKMVRLDDYLSGRLSISSEAFQGYGIKMFGQNVVEVGHGSYAGWKDNYFFLDDAYVSILLRYGTFLLVITLVSMMVLSKRASENKKFVLVIALVTISIHSVMEHRLIDIAYNPMILALFAFLTDKEQIDRRKKCIEETVKAG